MNKTGPMNYVDTDELADMGQTPEEALPPVEAKPEDVAGAIGGGLRSLGDAVRDKAPEGGMAGEASTAVANVLDSTGRYLQEQGFKEMAEDLKGLVQRYPIPSLLVGIGLGFLAGRAMGPRM